jgi:hypothetical protein
MTAKDVKTATAMKYARLNDIQFSDHNRSKQEGSVNDVDDEEARNASALTHHQQK